MRERFINCGALSATNARPPNPVTSSGEGRTGLGLGAEPWGAEGLSPQCRGRRANPGQGDNATYRTRRTFPSISMSWNAVVPYHEQQWQNTDKLRMNGIRSGHSNKKKLLVQRHISWGKALQIFNKQRTHKTVVVQRGMWCHFSVRSSTERPGSTAPRPSDLRAIDLSSCLQNNG